MKDKQTYFLALTLVLTVFTTTTLYCSLLTGTSESITFAFFACVISITTTIIAIGIFNKD